MSVGLPTPLTEQAETIDRVWGVFLVGAVAVGLLVLVLLTIVVVRYRRRGNRLPEQVHYRIRLEIAYTVGPLIAVTGLLALTLTSLHSVEERADNPDLVVEVLASQWHWQFDYPGLGVDVAPPEAGEPPELVLPQGATVEFRLRSSDVIHSFWVPGFLYKRDAIPGQEQVMQAAISGPPGTYHGVCAEFCGLAHTDMHFDVRIVSRDRFAEWVAGGDRP